MLAPLWQETWMLTMAMFLPTSTSLRMTEAMKTKWTGGRQRKPNAQMQGL